MTNLLEERLKAVRYTIIKKQEKRAEPHISIAYRRYLTDTINELKEEEQKILQELGVTGDLL